MERKRPTPKSQKRSSSAAAGPLALILVDGAKIRQKIKRAYERVRRDLGKAREDLDRFHKEDAPSYSRWISRQFGTLLVDLRETTRRIRELKQLFREIEIEI